MSENNNLDILKRQLSENEKNQRNLIMQRRQIEDTEERIHLCMQRYTEICEDIKNAYQGEQANRIHEIIYEETKEGEQKIFSAINQEYEDNELEQRKLYHQEKDLQEKYSIQRLKGEEE